ncbi:MAG: DsrE family protein [Gemmatimonadetes bacterium]|nr:DsrE family protein [Gemmatimonadota bacterium]
MARFAIVAQPQKADMGRAVHSLLYARQLKDGGHDVKVFYDGEGTTWIPRFEDPAFKYHDLYRGVLDEGLIGGACEYCAGAFGAKAAIETTAVPLVSDCNGHPDLAKMVAEGRTIITV